MRTIIHVNQHVLGENRKTGSREPPLSVKQGKLNRYASQVHILSSSRLVYRPDKPLKCGATLWIETEDEVMIY